MTSGAEARLQELGLILPAFARYGRKLRAGKNGWAPGVSFGRDFHRTEWSHYWNRGCRQDRGGWLRSGAGVRADTSGGAEETSGLAGRGGGHCGRERLAERDGEFRGFACGDQ